MINRSSFSSSRHLHGFTLVELMITVAILAIIVAVAVPAYTRQIQKSRRTDARNALLDLAGREERWLSVANSYSQNTTDLGYTGGWPVTTTNGYYNVKVTVPDPNAVSPNNPSFIITATAAGTQANDTACATFSVNQLGQQFATTSAAALNTATCWGS
jgi:type IV pilus assembly protein PilE